MLMESPTGIRIRVNKAMADADFNAKEAKLILVEQAETDLELKSILIALGADQAIRDYFYDSRRKERNNAERDFYRSRDVKDPDPIEIDEHFEHLLFPLKMRLTHYRYGKRLRGRWAA